MQAPLPHNEGARVAALQAYRVLDTLPESTYDDLVQIASAICGTPTALISLVDTDRQWFKARVGLDSTETSRDVAFCAHAILNPSEVLTVPDATKDARFVENPLVAGDPGIRFYAGAPLVTPEGEGLGTLCVMDYVPRNLEPHQLLSLQALARQVMQHLEMRREIERTEDALMNVEGSLLEMEAYQRSLEQSHHELEVRTTTD